MLLQSRDKKMLPVLPEHQTKPTSSITQHSGSSKFANSTMESHFRLHNYAFLVFVECSRRFGTRGITTTTIIRREGERRTGGRSSDGSRLNERKDSERGGDGGSVEGTTIATVLSLEFECWANKRGSGLFTSPWGPRLVHSLDGVCFSGSRPFEFSSVYRCVCELICYRGRDGATYLFAILMLYDAVEMD
ncbi:hypothetical protein GWI33_003723 [Rhynchophorus ferrugineus]|uniref:Uncharacterized protein n=1 Tax=Rhynchophorus ferrugineus TaxID=354439 RepID=A0A834HJP1_RHYFE|nr:hypothetical protein GWI33_003723 [Rhynchophorus ferrugineus]